MGKLLSARRRPGPRTSPLDVLLAVGCAALPWSVGRPAWLAPVSALVLLVLWFAVVRPTWRGLAPFLLTGALVLNATAVALVRWLLM